MPYFHVDDVFLTGFSAERCGFPRKAHPHFSPGRKEIDEVVQEQILIHYMEEVHKRGMFEKLNNNGKPMEEKNEEEKEEEKTRWKCDNKLSRICVNKWGQNSNCSNVD